MDVRVVFTVTLTLLAAERTPSETTTWKLYVPALVNVAVVFFAAFEPLELKVTAAGGVPVVDHVYVKADSPPSSLPSTLSCVLVPMTGEGEAAAGEAIVGGLAALTVMTTLAAVDLYPSETVTWNV
jgi:hypothetical protein